MMLPQHQYMETPLKSIIYRNEWNVDARQPYQHSQFCCLIWVGRELKVSIVFFLWNSFSFLPFRLCVSLCFTFDVASVSWFQRFCLFVLSVNPTRVFSPVRYLHVDTLGFFDYCFSSSSSRINLQIISAQSEPVLQIKNNSNVRSQINKTNFQIDGTWNLAH